MQILMVSLNLGISFFPARKPSYFKGVKLIPLTEDIGHHRSVLVCRRLTPAIRMIRDCMIEEMKRAKHAERIWRSAQLNRAESSGDDQSVF